jgi:hypothetical protein
MHICNDSSFFFTNKIGASAGDFECQIKFLERFSSMYSHNTINFVYNKLYVGPNGGCALSYNLIVQSYGWCSSNISAFFFSNISLKS